MNLEAGTHCVATDSYAQRWTSRRSSSDTCVITSYSIHYTKLYDVEIRRGLHAGASEVMFANLWGNILMFFPVGVLLIWIWTSPLLLRVLMATIAGTGLSVAIELTQLTMHRVRNNFV